MRNIERKEKDTKELGIQIRDRHKEIGMKVN